MSMTSEKSSASNRTDESRRPQKWGSPASSYAPAPKPDNAPSSAGIGSSLSRAAKAANSYFGGRPGKQDEDGIEKLIADGENLCKNTQKEFSELLAEGNATGESMSTDFDEQMREADKKRSRDG